MAKGLAEVLRFGRYEPLFRIGIGGMAEVYAARIRGEAGFQKLVAVKRMLPHLSGDQRFVNMFLDEARLAASITSPHVVQTLDLGRAEDDSLYIVMELAVGVTLADVMRWHGDRGDLCDPGVALELLAQAAQGLDDAHEARAPTGEPLHLVHRDISPQNILVGIDGRARVSDFGIAHAVHLRRTHTQVGEKKGKFSYFSPEQAFGRPLDRRSDVFSLGIVAWELLSGRRLFRGAMQEALLAVRERPVPHLSQVRPELPAEVCDTVMHALERDLDQRYATAAQMAASLRRAGLLLGGDPPTPRALGRFVQDVGGSGLAQMQERIASAGSGGNATGTAQLPVGLDPDEISHTRSLGSGDLIEVGSAPELSVAEASLTDTSDPAADTVEEAAAAMHSMATAPGPAQQRVADVTTAPGKRVSFPIEVTPVVSVDAPPLPGARQDPPSIDVTDETETTVEEPSLALAPTRIVTASGEDVLPRSRPPLALAALVIAGATVVLIAIGGLAALALSGGDEPTSVSLPDETAQVAVPSSVEPAVDPTPPNVAAVVDDEESPAAGEPEAPIAEPAVGETGPDEISAAEPEVVEPDGDETGVSEPLVRGSEVSARERERRRRRASRARERHRASEPPAMQTAAASTMREPATTDAPRETTTMQAPVGMRSSPLPGLDAFDRSVQN